MTNSLLTRTYVQWEERFRARNLATHKDSRPNDPACDRCGAKTFLYWGCISRIKPSGKRTACAECTGDKSGKCSATGKSPPGSPSRPRSPESDASSSLPTYTGVDRIAVLVSRFILRVGVFVTNILNSCCRTGLRADWVPWRRPTRPSPRC